MTRRLLTAIGTTTLVLSLVVVDGPETTRATAHPDHSNATAKAFTLKGSPIRAAVATAISVFADTGGVAAAPAASCVDGSASGYTCDGVDLLAHFPLSAIGGGSGNDMWGWTHQGSGRSFALMGRSNGTAFVEITDPTAPVYLGSLAGRGSASPWRDIKVIDDHAVIVSEAAAHGMQVFDLTELLNVASPPTTFDETTHYSGFGNAHNIVVNEDADAAYAVGTATCQGGLHIIDMSDPTAPAFSGCFSSDGYTHDAQCVMYGGPDVEHQGRHICFASNEDTLTIVDVTDPKNPAQISRTAYAGAAYTHQGWLSEDHATFFLDDELDEWNQQINTRTYVWDVANLDAPSLSGHHDGPTPSIDHNMYVAGRYLYQANYRSGLRVVEVIDADAAQLQEVAHFDTFPVGNGPGFNGAWSVYPFFEDGVVTVSDIERGLFVLSFEPPAHHVHNLGDKSRERSFDEKWRARVRINVRDRTHTPVAGAVITGRFGKSRVRSCTTNDLGRCSVSALVGDPRKRIPFEVTSVELAGSDYDATANHDPGGDSTGTRIVLERPLP
jgi:choice-of-anchor B domain-containing protein